MAKQYWVGEFYVDLSRNQISQLGQSQTLPPKALQVLTLLAENRGKVVSYDELMDTVWANSVVTPNTLQRCIAQLRKALGEDSKVQGIIKTHAKQGYSLECAVNWSDAGKPVIALDEQESGEETEHDKPESLADIVVQKKVTDQVAVNANNHKNAKDRNKYIWGVALASILVVVFAAMLPKSHKPRFDFGELRYLTATDDKEYGGTYSSDGKYILFHRYYNKLCINNIWAKNADTMQEIQLTKELGTYEGQSLSPDGKTLAFIQQQDCTKPVTQNVCFTLMSLDFPAALVEPQVPSELLRCHNSKISKPSWINNTQLVMLQKEAELWRLIRFSLQDKTTSTLYEPENGNIQHYAFSPERQMFVVTNIKDDGVQYLEMLSIEGEVLSSYPIQIPSTAPRHMIVRPQFVPNTNELIFAGGSKLYFLTYRGKSYQQASQIEESIGAPYFHPDASRLLLIKGRYDSDVSRLPIQQAVEMGQRGEIPTLSAFERSFYSEDFAKFQPNGKKIAFASKKTGTMQVWVLENNSATLLSRFPNTNVIDNLYWDTQGKSLLVQSNLVLYYLSLEGELSAVDFPYAVTDLFHWDSENQTVIANIRVNGEPEFVQVELSSLQYRTINNKSVTWALSSNNGTLVYTDHLGRFWQKQPGAAEDSLIEALSGQSSSKRFVSHNNQLYGINKQNQLWSYGLESAEFKVLVDVSADIDYLTDANHQELLLSFVVAAKKEVVEVSVNN